ncbi:MAG: PadR family transcriptional regulator, regulatory protein PadR [Nocardioidaceae bacterium]|jgi:DNA-binding PadR family transcriptional regulator|nr:PadR family transcriptional regulator, regulatory protein PadR [Nocardioidaceae bacterium]
MGTDRIKGNLDTLLLSVLQGGEAHGYEVITELKRRSQGEFDMPEGTVYPSLHRLEREGLLASSWDSSTGRRRRVYRLTARGVEAATEQRAEWKRFSLGMNAVLGTS